MNYNVSDKPYYCPNCGCIVNSNDKECKACEAQITPIQSYYTIDYCMKMSMNKYGTSRQWYDWLRQNEITSNKNFDKSSIKFSEIQNYINKQIKEINEKIYDDFEKEAQIEAAKPVYQPKCPICGSPHIKKISTTKKVMGAATFGIFSKTARSQWQCSSCGSKF